MVSMDQNATHRRRRRALSIAHAIGLFLAMLVICLPGIWIVLSSLRPTVEIMAKPPVWIPQEVSLDAYVAMFSGIGGNPKFLLDPNILRPASTLQIQITNNIGASATFSKKRSLR